MVNVQRSSQAHRRTVREMNLRANGVRVGTGGGGTARGIVQTGCVRIRILVGGVTKMCEVASEGLLGEVGAE